MWQQSLPNSVANLERTECKSAVSNPTAYHSHSSDPAYLQHQHQTHSPLARMRSYTHTETHRHLHGCTTIHRRWASGSSTPAFLVSAVISLKCPVFIGVRGANKVSEWPVRDNEQISGSEDSTEGKRNNKPTYKEKAIKFKVAPNHLARQWLTIQKFSVQMFEL